MWIAKYYINLLATAVQFPDPQSASESRSLISSADDQL